jgi:hypothetical protein
MGFYIRLSTLFVYFPLLYSYRKKTIKNFSGPYKTFWPLTSVTFLDSNVLRIKLRNKINNLYIYKGLQRPVTFVTSVTAQPAVFKIFL